MKPKKCKVKINWHGEEREFHTHANSERKALFNAIGQLAKELRVSICSVRHYVTDGKDRWKVEEVR